MLTPNGSAGMIVPTGIVTDNTTKDFFADLVRRQSLISLYDFENRQKIFPGIDSRIKFCLLTVGGEERRSAAAEFAFFTHSMAQLADADSRFRMYPQDFALFSPNTGNCPIFRSRRDMEINRKMYEHAGVLWQEANSGGEELNPWGVKFQSMFHMSNDSHLFRTREQLHTDGWKLRGNVFEREGGDDETEHWLPLYEAKVFHQYDHRFATFEGVSSAEVRQGQARDVSANEKQDPHTGVLPRYWIAEIEVQERLDRGENDTTIRSGRRNPSHHQSYGQTNNYRNIPPRIRTGTKGSNDSHQGWSLALRLIMNSTNRRTFISALIPDYGLGHKASVVHVNPGSFPSERQRTLPTRGHALHQSRRGQA